MPKKRFLLGGYDAKSCPEKVRKSHDPAYAGIELDLPTSGAQQRMESGVLRETTVGELWLAALGSRKFHVIDACDRSDASKARREAQTVELMREPGHVQVIWNARLPQLADSHRTGEPDALVRGVDRDGKPTWFPVDVKDHRSLEGTSKAKAYPVSKLEKPLRRHATDTVLGVGIPQKSDALQLAHYYRMIDELGFATERPIGGIVGRESVIIWHDLDAAIYNHEKLGKVSALAYYDQEFAQRVNIASQAIKGIALTGPEWKTECSDCPFRTVCHDELRLDLDHITLLPGITPKRAQAHYATGVSRIDELARMDWRTARLVDLGVDVPSVIVVAKAVDPETPASQLVPKVVEQLEKLGLRTAADLSKLDPKTATYTGTGVWNLAGSIDQARVTKVGKVHLQREVDFVGLLPSTIEQDVDIEDCDGHVYLIGVRTVGRKKEGEDWKLRSEYNAFVDWSHTPEGEARVFAEFWAHIQGWRDKAKANKWGYRAYHYTKHENAAFLALAERHAGKEGIPTVDEVKSFLDSKEWTDLHRVVSTQLIWPTESVTLKDIAKWVRFSWRDSDPGGGNSIAWYKTAIGSDDEDVRNENRQRLLKYNADDCQAQVMVREWLNRLGEARQPGKRLPNVAALDKRFARRIRTLVTN
jgi:predicted RecB family nuclease